jgi:hypothetical protein
MKSTTYTNNELRPSRIPLEAAGFISSDFVRKVRRQEAPAERVKARRRDS